MSSFLNINRYDPHPYYPSSEVIVLSAIEIRRSNFDRTTVNAIVDQSTIFDIPNNHSFSVAVDNVTTFGNKSVVVHRSIAVGVQVYFRVIYI